MRGLPKLYFLILVFLISCVAKAQSTRSYLPKVIDPSVTYLFYLHGAIVQEQGVNAVSEVYGPYEYLKILDTLSSYGFRVISERRPKGTQEAEYAKKVSLQIDTLLKTGVDPQQIVVVGASLGAYIATEISYQLKNNRVKFAVLGFCSDYSIEFYSKYKKELCGNFLSIYESTDQKKSCNRLLGEKDCKAGYQEIQLNIGNGHGFLYKPYPEWVHPLVQWIRS